MKFHNDNKGISLISLIIIIIVIIILAAIVIFSGMDTPERANLAKFTQQADNIQMAITEEYSRRMIRNTTNFVSRSEEEMYYLIASGAQYSASQKIDLSDVRAGSIVDIDLNSKPDTLHGNYFYEINNSIKIAGIKDDKGLYATLGTEEKHYITDKGEFFILPGYRQDDGEITRWWINSGKYYEGDEITVSTKHTITYDANGGYFETPDVTQNQVQYDIELEKQIITKYSHTFNISNGGIAVDSLNSAVNNNEVITIPGATSLHVDLYYSTYNASTEWVCVWEGKQYDYSAAHDFDYSVLGDNTGKFGGGGNKSTKEEATHIFGDISGDSVTFGRNLTSSTNFGYYAVITR